MRRSVLLCLLWYVVVVHSQTKYPYVSFMGETLPNHAYVDLSLVGNDDSGSDSVKCHTDLSTCCTGAHRGDWFPPGSDQTLPFSSESSAGVYEVHGNKRVDLRHRNNADRPYGILYRCDIATTAVHDDDDPSVRQSVYLGIYASGGSVISLEYFTLTSPTYLPPLLDGYSEAIDIPGGFPFGSQSFFNIFVNNNGIISMESIFTSWIPESFPHSFRYYLVAPFWDDVDITGGVGNISYQVYSTGSPLLDTVNTIISAEENINFRGHWMLVAEWDSVPAYGGSPNQTNTFQSVIVTDGMNSFAIFIYQCGDLQWNGYDYEATIGFGAGSEYFSNHWLSGSPYVTSIACLNTPDNQFFSLLYKLTESRYGDPAIFGGVTITINLNVASPQFTLTCISTGGPATTVTWTRDFDTVTEGTKTVLDDQVAAQYTHTLTVTEPTSFNGTYTCRVSNNKPSTASVIIRTTVVYTGYDLAVPIGSSSTITVQIPTPSIIVSNTDAVYAGTTLNLTCNYILSLLVDTTPQTAVTWMVDGVAVDTSPGRIFTDGATLSFSPLATSDSGSYRCTLTVTGSQTYGSIQGESQSVVEIIYVTDLSNFEVTVSPQYDTVLAGEAHRLQCTVTNIRYLAVSPTVELIGPRGSVLAINMSFTLTHTLIRVMTSHAGQYTCRALVMIPSVSVNVSGQNNSTLTVQIPQPGANVTLSHTPPLYAGTGLTLICTVTLDPNVDTNPGIMGVWDFESRITRERYSIYGNNSVGFLTITPLLEEDNGTYVCTVVFKGGDNVLQSDSATDNITITVMALPAPVVSIYPSSGSPTAGQTYSLTCSVQVVAHLVVEPSVEWTRQDGTVLNASSGYSLQLSFNPLMISNISLYTCRAIANISYVISNTGEASFLLAAPSGASQAFEAVAGKRQVVFSWTPPPVTQHNGLITSYTLSCSPSPSSLPQSPSQSGPLTVAGFSPNTSYSCSVVANNGLGSGPPAHTNFTTLQDYSYFQIGLGEVVTCSKWIGSSTDRRIEDITNAVMKELNVSCTECGITNDIIDEQLFACVPQSPTYVTYRARLEGTSETDSGSLISLIEEWVSNGASIIVTGVLMTVDTECSVAIASLSEGQCSATTESTMTTNDSTVTTTESTMTTNGSTMPAIIGGVVAVILIIALPIAAVVVTVTFIMKSHGKVSIKNSNKHAFTNGKKGGSIATTDNIAYETIKRNGQDDLNGSSIATTTNVAYEMIKLGEQDEHVYDVVDVCGVANPSYKDGTNRSPCLPPVCQLLPTIPPPTILPIVAPQSGGNVGVTKEREEDNVYATIPGDQ